MRELHASFVLMAYLPTCPIDHVNLGESLLHVLRHLLCILAWIVARFGGQPLPGCGAVVWSSWSSLVT